MAQRPSSAKFIWPVAAIAIAGGAILLSNREPIGPGGRAIIRTPEDYQRENAIARDLSLATLRKASEGGEVTEEEKAKLRQALPHLQAMNAYSPIKVSPYFAMGQIYQILGDTQAAGTAYEQAIMNETADWEEKENPDMHATVVEAKALLAETLLQHAVNRTQVGAQPAELKQIRTSALTWAEQAVKAQPSAPRYLAAKASALLALGREEEAKAVVIEAAAADPNHFKVRPLASLVGL